MTLSIGGHGGEGESCMRSCDGGPGDGSLYRSVGLSFTREVEAHSDPPSPLFASGKGSLLQIRLRRLLIMESGGFRSSTLPLRNPVYFGLRLPSVEISMFDGTRRREDSAVKNGYGFVGGLSVSQLRRTGVLMVWLRRRRGGGG
ncbi:hypothetical protein IGI04_028438 [Brassica rapa subsp. trilocularis]|uniref:Uncharacterized protein n=1 Tax=Brassica rapa subsp. trilocularis TaxID=1813537 RepID=A0ABQ7L1Y7_BRACM|nr:hypothetical protein IGI04_028438 [Brassica rapa subsp. trilocularis]